MTTAAAPGRTPAETDRLARLLGALPLVTVFAWFALAYAWQAWLVETPFIFVDELKYTELSRGIAETGLPRLRGERAALDSLAVVLTAPAWLIGNTEIAYQLAKYLGVLAMTAAVFPAYFLARMLVSPGWAVFAAAGTVAIPALTYSSLLLEEPLAYGVSTLALFLFVRALTLRTRGWIALAVGVALVAPLVRGQLAILPTVLLLATLTVVWTGERARRWRSTWTASDWVGAGTLAVGAAVLANAVLSSESFSWLAATRENKDRMLEYGLWAGGAFTIGLGVLPVVAGFALLATRRRPPDRAWTAFAAVLGTSVAAFGFYTAVKAAYLSTVFATRVAERNLIYLAPLFFVATAVWLTRPRLQPVGVIVAAALALVMLVTMPIVLDFPYFEAPGYAILVFANRHLSVPAETLEAALLLVLAVSLVLIGALWAVSRRFAQAGRGLAVGIAALVLGWNLLGELEAAAGGRDSSRRFMENFPDPPTWIDDATGGADALYLGQQIVNANGIHLLEFWNRSLDHVWSLDGTAPGPGRTVTPDLATPNGALFPNLAVRYAVADSGIEVVGDLVAQRGSLRLYRVDPPLRLTHALTGIFTDGWTSDRSGYSQFATSDGQAGTMRVIVSRAAVGGTIPGEVTVRLGPLVIGPDSQPALGAVTAVRRGSFETAAEHTFAIPTPRPPFRVEVDISPTFVPAEVDPRSSDRRRLGAQVSYEFVPR